LLNAWDPESIRLFYVYTMGLTREKIEVRESGDYILLVYKSNTRRRAPAQAIVSVLLFLSMLRRGIVRRASRIRDVLVVNKKYASLDAMCAVYGWRNRIRMVCTGRPEAISAALDMFNPDVLTTVNVDPSTLPQCGDREIIYYATPSMARVYYCRLRDDRLRAAPGP